MIILGYEDSKEGAARLAAALGIAHQQIECHRFPDEEVRVCLPEQLPAHILIYRSLDRPDPKLIELLLTCKTARQLGTQRISLIAPYLCYMRQDVAFHPGESVSQRVIGEFLAGLVEDVLTIDPHLHRTHALAGAIPAQRAVACTAAPLIGDFIAQRFQAPLMLGPDSESQQWVQTIAEGRQLEWAVAEKTRLGDRAVRITLPEVSFTGKDVVLIDDVISSGHTMIEIAAQLKSHGIKSLHCIVTHALFAGDSYQRMLRAGFNGIWSSNSIPHPSNAIPLAGLIASKVRELLRAA
ncbi:MAG: ribose-phosphate diphosphokinase [Pseudomonadota bacterium]